MISKVKCNHCEIKAHGQLPKFAKFNSSSKQLLSAVGILNLFLAAQATALKPEQELTIEKHMRPAQTRSVDDIARQIRQQHKWRILVAEPTIANQKTLYRFKLLNKKRGRVSVVVIDPKQPNLQTLN